jgi:hypothetical protein
VTASSTVAVLLLLDFEQRDQQQVTDETETRQ